ncbi:MAG: DUF2299 family protein, partial [Planctomycetes bacterium]|nr:DUF2299 family protein [Planctomycetota bacterium]
TLRNDPQHNAIFQLEARDQQGRRIAISRMRDDDQLLTIAGGWQVSTEHQQDIAGLSEESRAELLEDLAIDLARFGLAYDVSGHPLDRITLIDKMVCDDSFSRVSFLQHVGLVRRGLALTNEYIRRGVRLSKQQASQIPTVDTEDSPPQPAS